MIILENTKEYKDTKLTLPVGIGVVQTESAKNFYNTSDADATSADILIDKTAYGKYGKLTGTLDLDAEKEISYQDGYETGKVDGYDSGYSIGYEGGYNAGETEQKSKLTSITITENGSYTRENGYNEVVVDVPDLNGDYNEGYTDGETAGYSDGYAEGLDDGITDGRNQIIEEQSDANITASDVTLGKIGYGANNEKIVGTSEAITSIDVAASGIKFAYSTFTEVPSYYDFSNVTSMYNMFNGCSSLTTIPQFDTSNVTDMNSMFNGCSKLTSVPLFDTSKVTSMYNMFNGCSKLTSVPLFDTSKVTSMYNMFRDCSNLTSIPLFDTSKVTNMDGFVYKTKITEFPLFDTSNVTDLSDCFYQTLITTLPMIDTSKVTTWEWAFSLCSYFTHFPSLSFEAGPNLNYMFYNTNNLEIIDELDFGYMRGGWYNGFNMFTSGNFSKLTTLGGFKDLGKSYYNGSNSAAYKDLPLNNLPALTYQSCMNVINKVYDMNLNTQNTYTPKIRFHATPYALLSADDIAIATAKGWTVQAG